MNLLFSLIQLLPGLLLVDTCLKSFIPFVVKQRMHNLPAWPVSSCQGTLFYISLCGGRMLYVARKYAPARVLADRAVAANDSKALLCRLLLEPAGSSGKSMIHAWCSLNACGVWCSLNACGVCMYGAYGAVCMYGAVWNAVWMHVVSGRACCGWSSQWLVSSVCGLPFAIHIYPWTTSNAPKVLRKEMDDMEQPSELCMWICLSVHLFRYYLTRRKRRRVALWDPEIRSFCQVFKSKCGLQLLNSRVCFALGTPLIT